MRCLQLVLYSPHLRPEHSSRQGQPVGASGSTPSARRGDKEEKRWHPLHVLRVLGASRRPGANKSFSCPPSSRQVTFRRPRHWTLPRAFAFSDFESVASVGLAISNLSPCLRVLNVSSRNVLPQAVKSYSCGAGADAVAPIATQRLRESTRRSAVTKLSFVLTPCRWFAVCARGHRCFWRAVCAALRWCP